MNATGKAARPVSALPRAVVVHGWEDARAALRPGLPVTLLSAPDAAAFAGIGWWRALVDGVGAETGTASPDILDCGDSAGLAVQALRNGCRVVVLDPLLPAWADVACRAESVGAAVLSGRPRALDLALPGAPGRVAAWLRDSAVPLR